MELADMVVLETTVGNDVRVQVSSRPYILEHLNPSVAQEKSTEL